MNLTIDGKTVPVIDETTVLEVAQREGIWIPTFCHHPGLPPYGACRLCVVEVKAGGRPGLAASCTLPVVNGLVIETNSPRVRRSRRILLQLLLAVAPGSAVVKELAEKMGVNTTPFEINEQENNCALCGLCVRVCNQVGAHAIGFAFRGTRRKVTPPFDKPTADCVGCRACASVCPTGDVQFTQKGDRLFGENWGADLSLARCSSCGRLFTADRLFDHVRTRLGPDYSEEKICPTCRRRITAKTMAGVYQYK
ncbi:MAG TPA: 2Fe-2S iron-sulfur cluster binding domain-containing protein [Syntrophomonadaceae bacterium]|nr:2Fe-2S iron-sulfur cluster binding domain-containing protein [Syntrophomonadaceae bacterium]